MTLSPNIISQYIPFIIFHHYLDAVVLFVIRVSLDGSVALNDAVLNMRIVSDVNVIQNDGVLDIAVISDERPLEYQGILYGSVDNASAGNKTVLNANSYVVLGWWKIYNLGVDSWIITEEVVTYLWLKEVHVGSVIIFY